MTYPEAIEFLRDLSLFGMNPGLENTHRLAMLARNPQDEFRFIHIADTPTPPLAVVPACKRQRRST